MEGWVGGWEVCRKQEWVRVGRCGRKEEWVGVGGVVGRRGE